MISWIFNRASLCHQCMHFSRNGHRFKREACYRPLFMQVQLKLITLRNSNHCNTFHHRIFAGMSLGTAATMLISGYLIHYFGWPAVFYASGGCTLIWFVLWSLLVVNKPADHPRISAEELEYISASLSSSGVDEKQKLPPVPWKLVLTSGPFWAIMFCQTLETWGLYTLLHEIPTYMQNVLHFDMKQVSAYTCGSSSVYWASKLIVFACVAELHLLCCATFGGMDSCHWCYSDWG